VDNSWLLKLRWRVVAGALAGLLFLAAGALVALAPIFGLALAAAPFATVLAASLVDQAIKPRSRAQAVGAGLVVGMGSSFLGAALFTAASIASSSDTTERSMLALFLFATASTVSLGIGALPPSLGLGVLWALLSRRALSEPRT
jgi:hypothetical protein